MTVAGWVALGIIVAIILMEVGVPIVEVLIPILWERRKKKRGQSKRPDR